MPQYHGLLSVPSYCLDFPQMTQGELDTEELKTEQAEHQHQRWVLVEPKEINQTNQTDNEV
jgi:hypothetical protein